MQSGLANSFEPLIETSKLTKQFGSLQALTDLNLRIMPGEIYGLLGPNGAGKTTAIKTILGLLEPNSGWVKVAGFNPALDSIMVKGKIGYVAENPLVYDSLSPRDFLEFVASIRKLDQGITNERIFQLASAFDMSDYFDSPIATLSLGMKQKVALIASLFHQPPVLLLDEPLNGLDAKSSRIFKDLVSFHAQKGGAILFTTHIMEIAEQVCTRIGIIDQGKVIIEGTLEQLRGEARDQTSTLEEVFFKLTKEKSEVTQITEKLREAFFKHETE